MLISLLAMTAFALDCSDPTLNDESCAATNAVSELLDTDFPGLVVDGATPARFATENIYGHFEEIRSSAALNGCEFGGATIEGVITGSYNGNAGSWTGDWADFGDTGTASGVIDRASRTWSGTYVGDDSGVFGDLFATFDRNGNLVGNRDDGFLAGRWIRIRGSRGLFVSVSGTCAGDPAEAINAWYDAEDLTPFSELSLPIDGTISFLGTGTGALLGGDLTDPEDDGDELAGADDPSWNWISIAADDEPGFGGGEFAYNIFDNLVGGGNAKWCCTDVSPEDPRWVAVEFANPIELTHFTLTSGNDTPGRDPSWWHVEGSDNGSDWAPIFVQNAPDSIWGERNQVARIDLEVPAPAFTHFRYIAFENNDGLHQIGELELFGNVVLLD